MTICDSGWTSLGDYSLDSPGPDCLINSLAVRVMSYFLIILPSCSNILTIWHFISIGVRKGSVHVISREYKALFPLSFLFLGIYNALCGILKVSYVDEQQPLIGRDLSVTLVNAFSYFFTFLGLVLYLQVIIQFLRGYSRMMSKTSCERVSKRLGKMSTYSWYTIPASVISSILPLIALAYPSHSKELCMAHLIGLAVSAFFYGLIFANCLSFLINELNDYINSMDPTLSNGLKTVVSRLTVAYYFICFMCSNGGIIYIIFASSNYLFHVGTYLYHIMSMVVPPVSYVLIITVAGTSQSENKQSQSNMKHSPSIHSDRKKRLLLIEKKGLLVVNKAMILVQSWKKCQVIWNQK